MCVAYDVALKGGNELTEGDGAAAVRGSVLERTARSQDNGRRPLQHGPLVRARLHHAAPQVERDGLGPAARRHEEQDVSVVPVADVVVGHLSLAQESLLLV